MAPVAYSKPGLCRTCIRKNDYCDITIIVINGVRRCQCIARSSGLMYTGLY